jgi:hypothetical protein
MTALGRVGEPADIGPMIAALLSDDNRWVNGQRIEVSGGMALESIPGASQGPRKRTSRGNAVGVRERTWTGYNLPASTARGLAGRIAPQVGTNCRSCQNRRTAKSS